MILFLLFIDFMMTAASFAATGIYYNSMPDKIPVFVNLMNEPVLLAGKNIFTAFRLPLMALLLQLVCLLMYFGRRKNAGESGKTRLLLRNFWLAASLTAAIKLSLSWIPFTGALPYYIIPIFRVMTIAAALLGVLYMLAGLIRMFGEVKMRGMAGLFAPAGKADAAIIAALLLLYVIAVFLPGLA